MPWLSAVPLLPALAAAATSPPLPRTCCPTCPEASAPYCDRSLGFEARASDLAKRLNLTEQVGLFFSYPGTPYIPRLNLKGWSLDHTCIHGLNKFKNVTVFPHAIAQGATWDLALVRRMGNVTAVEARALSEQTYQNGGGKNQGSSLSCDGGPLANTAHDPRWGRISETYGEDPVLVQAMGVAALQSMQNPQKVPGGADTDVWMATRQVTRHYIGYHSAHPDIGYPLFNATNRSLADSYFPTYESFQRVEEGRADGIMCAMTELNGVPSCASDYLLKDILREEWGSDAIVQTDCCDSIQTINNPFHYKNTTNNKDALRLAVEAGVGVYFGFIGHELRPYMDDLLASGALPTELIEKYAARVVLSFMRLGFFDTLADDYPFPPSLFPRELVESTAHQSLAVESAAKSVVLLRNAGGALPLSRTGSIAVVGPFAECGPGSQGKGTDRTGNCYLHSYNGQPTNLTTVLDGVRLRVSAKYALGSNVSCPDKEDGCWSSGVASDEIAKAVSTAKASDVTILALGLGRFQEAESHDRVNMTLPPLQQQLLHQVSAAARKLVVVLVSAGGVDIDESLADAVVWAPYGGQAAGEGVARVLFGEWVPSGRLPLTFYTQAWADSMNAGGDALSIRRLDLEAGVGRTHRYLPAEGGWVKHWLGYGLSYTSFSYAGLKVSGDASAGLTVSFTVQNTGSLAGTETPQVYLSAPSALRQGPAPLLNLVGFASEHIAPGTTSKVTVNVAPKQLQTADNSGKRSIIEGTYTLWVGGHHPHDKEALGALLSTTLKL